MTMLPINGAGKAAWRGLILGVGLILILAAMPAAVDAATRDPTVTISSFEVTPAILLPGDQGTITITITNTATESSETESLVDTTGAGTTTTSTTKDIPVLVESVYVYGNGMEVLEGNFQHVGALGPGQSIPLTILVRAPAQTGLYFPEVWIRIPDGTSVKYPIPVNVNSPVGIQKQAILILESHLPDSVNPGDEVPVALTIRNDGQLLADEVTLRVGNFSTWIAPRDTDLHHIGTIPAGAEKTQVITLLSDRQTTPGLIQVPVTLQYSAVDGSIHRDTTSINVVMSEHTPFDLTVRIENTGTGEAKAVSARIDLSSEGTKEAFIGKIKPGNDAPALFILEGLGAGTYPYNITISYTDDLGAHVVERQLSLRVPPTDHSVTILLGILGLAVLGFCIYRYWYIPRKNGSGALPWVKKN
ncbi:MAG: S-layer protein [Methanomicrobiales archaeon]|nr:S-layer protein [Methanomicrobiales archaeon]